MSKFAELTVTISVNYGGGDSLNKREQIQGGRLGTSKAAWLTGITAVARLAIWIILLMCGGAS